MPTPVVLIVTAGRSDLQLLIPNAEPGNDEKNEAAAAGTGAYDPRRLAEMRVSRWTVGEGLAELHSAIMGGAIAYAVNEEQRFIHPDRLVRHREAKLTIVGNEIEAQLPDEHGEKYISRTPCHTLDADGETPVYSFVLPKISPILASLAQSIQDGESAVACALVLNTHRLRERGEPFALGKLVSEYIARRIGLDPGGRVDGDAALAAEQFRGRATWIDYLVGNERIEGVVEERLNPLAVARIDAALKAIAEAYPRCDVWLFQEGGVPGIKDVLHASACLRFHGAVVVVEARERQNRAELVDPRRKGATPAEDFRLRHTVRLLVERGEFASAWALVQAHDALFLRSGRYTWIGALDQARRILAGANPSNMSLAWARTLSGYKHLRSLRTALKAECHLRAGELVAAAAQTSKLIEVAILDAVEQHFGANSRIDDGDARLAIPAGIRISKAWTNGFEPLLKSVTGQPGTYDYYFSGPNRVRVLDSLRKLPLIALHRAHDDQVNGTSVRTIRNSLTHADPDDPAFRNEIISVFQGSGLWLSDAAGFSVFASQLVCDVLSSLGVTDPGSVYLNLEQGVLRAIADFSYRPPLPPDP